MLDTNQKFVKLVSGLQLVELYCCINYVLIRVSRRCVYVYVLLLLLLSLL